MPAAAVIPAPIAYIKVVAVKKLVVEFVFRTVGSPPAVLTGMFAERPAGGCSVSDFGHLHIRLINPVAVLLTECRGGPARLL